MYLLKDDDANSGSMFFYLSPSRIAIYETIDWKSVLYYRDSSIEVTDGKYDFSSNRVTLTFVYHSTIESSSI